MRSVVSEVMFDEGDIVPGESRVCELDEIDNED